MTEEEEIRQRIDEDFLESVEINLIPKEKNDEINTFKKNITKMFDEVSKGKAQKLVVNIGDVYQGKLRKDLSGYLENLNRLLEEIRSENKKLERITIAREKEINALFYYPLKERLEKIEEIKIKLINKREIIKQKNGSFYLNDIFDYQEWKIGLILVLDSKAKSLSLKLRDELISFDYSKLNFGNSCMIFDYPSTDFVLEVLEKNSKLKSKLASQKEEIICLDWSHHNRSKIALFFVGIVKKYLKK